MRKWKSLGRTLSAVSCALSLFAARAESQQDAPRPKPFDRPSAQVPSHDSLRALIARELPDVSRRPADGPPLLAVLVAERDGRIRARKALSLTSEHVAPLEVLEKEFSLKPDALHVSLVALLDGPKKISNGSLWVVWGKVE